MSQSRDATSSELPDLHDLSDAEVDALPLWHRACYILHPFNAAGLRFKSIEEWAETFFYQDPVGATEDAKRLLGFLERWALRSETAATAQGECPTCSYTYPLGKDPSHFCSDYNPRSITLPSSKAPTTDVLREAINRLNSLANYGKPLSTPLKKEIVAVADLLCPLALSAIAARTGWRSVPEQPTEAMIEAGVKDTRPYISHAEAEEIYKAMLRFAPSTDGSTTNG